MSYFSGVGSLVDVSEAAADLEVAGIVGAGEANASAGKPTFFFFFKNDCNTGFKQASHCSAVCKTQAMKGLF